MRRLVTLILIIIMAAINFSHCFVYAAGLSSLSDTLSSQKASDPSNHTLSYITSTGLSSGNISIDFSAAVSSTNSLDYTDIDLSYGATGVETQAALGAVAGINVWGAAVNPLTKIITLTYPLAGATPIAPNDKVIIKLGLNASHQVLGDNQMTNSLEGDSLVIGITSGGNSGKLAVVLLNSASVGLDASNPKPTAPSALAATATSSSQINLVWQDNASNEAGFKIERKVGSGSFTEIASLAANTTSYSDAGLVSATTYTYRIRAYNIFDYSDYSNEAVATTQTEGTSFVFPPPPPPIEPPKTPIVSLIPKSEVQIINITQTSALVKWNTANDANSQVDYGLTLGYELPPITNGWFIKNHEISLIGLASDTLYHLKVVSFDADNNKFYSDDLTFKTLAVPLPVNVSDLTAVGTDKKITLKWINPTDPELLRIQIQRSETGYPKSLSEGVKVYEGANQTFVDTNVINGKLYYYTVFVVNKFSAVSSGAIVSATPKGVKPLVPPVEIKDLQAVASDKQISLTWGLPMDPNITSYKIYRSLSSGSEIYLSTTSLNFFVDKDVDYDQIYYYKIKPVDLEDVEGDFSNEVFATVKKKEKIPGQPGIILDLNANVVDNKVVLTWSQPVDDGGSAITGYEIYRSLSSGAEVLYKKVTGINYVDIDVSAGQRYYYQVKAINANMSGNLSNEVMAYYDKVACRDISIDRPSFSVIASKGEYQTSMANNSGSSLDIILNNGLINKSVFSLDAQNVDQFRSYYPEAPNPSLNNILGGAAVAGKNIASIEPNLNISDIYVNINYFGGTANCSTSSQNFKVYYFDSTSNQWKEVKSSVDNTRQLLKINNNLFGYYAIYYDLSMKWATTLKPSLMIKIASQEILDLEEKEVMEKVKITDVLTGEEKNIDKSGKFESTAGEEILIQYFNDQSSKAIKEAYIDIDGQKYLLVFNQKTGSWETRLAAFKRMGEYIARIDLSYVDGQEKSIVLQMSVKEKLEALPPISMENLVSNIGQIKNIADIKNKLIPEQTQKVIDTAQPAVQIAAIVSTPLVIFANAGVAFGFQNFFAYLHHLINWLLSLLGLRKRKKSWGVIYDSITKKPVSLAIVRILDAKNKALIETQVTDNEGRFSFIEIPGEYLVSVVKKPYLFPSSLIKGRIDGEFENLYHGETVKVADPEKPILINIPLDPEAPKKTTNSTWKKILDILSKYSKIISFINLTMGAFLYIYEPTTLHLVLLIIYGVMYSAINFFVPKAEKNWGVVFDTNSLQPVQLANISLIDNKTSRVMKTRLTDYYGRFSFFPPTGDYKIVVSKPEYEFKPQQVGKIKKYHNLYNGQHFEVKKNNPFIRYNIPLSKTTEWKPMASS